RPLRPPLRTLQSPQARSLAHHRRARPANPSSLRLHHLRPLPKLQQLLQRMAVVELL
ncbi:hypothetical protein LTR16_008478, partial [Cryomyces antarcticus]